MATDQERRRQLRMAYAEAWAHRVATDDLSEEVLAERLREHHLHEVLDETAAIHQYVFDLWRRGVPPHRWNREGLKLTGRVAVQLVETGRSIFQMFRPISQAALADEHDAYLFEEMPTGKHGVTDYLREPASAMLTFERTEWGDTALRECARGRGDLLGWRRPGVWFDMHPDQPRAHVAIGRTVVGETQVPVEIWRKMREAAEGELYADGFLEVRLRNGKVETGTLLCCYAAEPPGPLVSDLDDD